MLSAGPTAATARTPSVIVLGELATSDRYDIAVTGGANALTIGSRTMSRSTRQSFTDEAAVRGV